MVQRKQHKRLFVVILMTLVAVAPFLVSEGWVSLLTEVFIMIIAALAANLLAGYANMVSFGVAGFYGIGAYITALVLQKLGSPFSLAFIAGPVGAAIISIPVGWFCVRLTSIYFAMLTLAFAQLMYTIAHTWYSFTGGDDGIVGINIPTVLLSHTNYYYFSLGITIVCIFLMWRIVKSPFGRTIMAFRENAARVEFIGINPRRYQLGIFIVSSFFLGVAGSLYCGFNQSVFANSLYWSKTFDITVAFVLGGMYNFGGPVVGAFVYIFASKILSGYTEYWPLALGLVIVLSTIFMKRGIVGSLSEYLNRGNGDV